MPTPQQRQAQFDAVVATLGPCKTARLNSDALAAKIGADAPALAAAKIEFNQAFAAVMTQAPGSGARFDAAQQNFMRLQAAVPGEMKAAQDAYEAFTASWKPVADAVQALLVDPGAVEQVQG